MFRKVSTIHCRTEPGLELFCWSGLGQTGYSDCFGCWIYWYCDHVIVDSWGLELHDVRWCSDLLCPPPSSDVPLPLLCVVWYSRQRSSNLGTLSCGSIHKWIKFTLSSIYSTEMSLTATVQSQESLGILSSVIISNHIFFCTDTSVSSWFPCACSSDVMACWHFNLRQCMYSFV